MEKRDSLRHLADATRPGADIAGAAVLLEIGSQLGVLSLLQQTTPPTSVREVAERAGIPEEGAAKFLNALTRSGMMEEVPSSDDSPCYRATALLPALKLEAGYVCWGIHAGRPFIDHPIEFLSNLDSARQRFKRDGRLISITSAWMGEGDFYPATLDRLLALKPKRIVDLGAGSGRLVLHVLARVDGSTGVCIDMDLASCNLAKRNAEEAGMRDRVEVHHRSVESLASDGAVLEGADIINAGFVLHDLIPEEEERVDRVLANCASALSATGGTMFITEIYPYSQEPNERVFSAALTFLHEQFMGRRIQTQEEWTERLLRAGFAAVEPIQIPMPGSRLYLARG